MAIPVGSTASTPAVAFNASTATSNSSMSGQCCGTEGAPDQAISQALNNLIAALAAAQPNQINGGQGAKTPSAGKAATFGATATAAGAAADNSGQPPMTEREAIQSFLNHPLPDGMVLSQGNLEHIARGNSPQKKAAQYFLDHPSAYFEMQSAAQRSHGNNNDTDGKFVNNDLIARLNEINGGQGATALATGNAATYGATAAGAGAAVAAAAHSSGQPPMTERDALESFLNNPPPDGAVLDQTTMEGIAKGNGPQKKAAQYFLDHPSAYNAMQSANERSKGNNSDYDGKFVKDDMIARLNEINSGQVAATAATGNAATFAATDTAAGAGTAVAADNSGQPTNEINGGQGATDPSTGNAATYAAAATAAGAGTAVAAAADNSGQPPMTERDALESFLNNPPPDGAVLDQAKMQDIANSSGPQKQAAQYFLDHPSAYNAMQSATERSKGNNNDYDGKFSKDDMIARLNEMNGGQGITG